MTHTPIGEAELASLPPPQREFVERARDWVWENRDLHEWLDVPTLVEGPGGPPRPAVLVPIVLLSSFRTAVGCMVDVLEANEHGFLLAPTPWVI